MNIILSNYRYFISGGPERYMFSIKKLLEEKGHEVIPFSVKSSKNKKTKYSKYFLDAIGSENSTYFHEYKLNLKSITKILTRQIYSPEGYFKARKLSRETSPDLLYSLHFLNKMSPSILDGFKSTKIPIVVRISDFGLICPQGHLYSNGAICEACINEGFSQAIKKKCVKGSIAGSIIKALALKIHRIIGSIERVDAWIFPSKFTRKKYIDAGFEEEKTHYIPTFIDTDTITPEHDVQEHFLYFGRVVEEKGVHLLLKAYDKLCSDKPKLLIVGNQEDTTYSSNLVQIYGKQVDFIQFMPKSKLSEYIKKAIAIIIPSVWYDNLPNVLLEAYAHGKPVIAPNHGCFSEFVSHKYTGLLYSPNNTEDLVSCLKWANNNKSSIKKMGRDARRYVEQQHSPGKHCEALLKIFGKFA